MVRYIKFAFIALITLFSSVHSHAKVEPTLAGLLSIVPGLGQAANGNIAETPVWLGLTVGLGLVTRSRGGFYLARDFWAYNIYDAYRDARPNNKMTNIDSSVLDYFAMVNPLNAIDLIGPPEIAIGAWSGLSKYKGKNLTVRQFFTASAIGFGEEGLFRGFLFPVFSDITTSKIAGAVSSSVLFALVHTQYGLGGKLQMFGFGMLGCLQYYLSNYHLSHTIFSHGWWDFFLIPPNDKVTGQDGPLIRAMIPSFNVQFHF